MSRSAEPSHLGGSSAGGSPRPAPNTYVSLGRGCCSLESAYAAQKPVNNTEPSHSGTKGSPSKLPKAQEAISHARPAHPVHPDGCQMQGSEDTWVEIVRNHQPVPREAQ